METSKINQVVDIRQSPQWGEYLKSLGWKKHTLGEYKNLYCLKTGPLVLAKMQRPANLSADDLVKLDQLAQENHFAFVKLEPSLDQDIELLAQLEYKPSMSPLCPPSTIFIDMENSVEMLQSNLSRSAKYSIHRAVREGGKVEMHKNPGLEVLNQVYPAYKETTEKQRFLGPSFTDLKIKKELWGDKCHLAVSKNADGQIQGVNMFLCFENRAWFIHGATRTEARKTRSGYLLLWEAIKYLKSQGCKLLDLEGKDDRRFPSFTKHWGGFSHFKERFGGNEIAYPYPQIKYYSKTLKIFSRLYNSMLPL